jgi:hypothetical protein
MREYEQVSANGRESGVLSLYRQLAGRGGRVGNGRGGWVRVNRESDSDKNVRGGEPTNILHQSNWFTWLLPFLGAAEVAWAPVLFPSSHILIGT